MRDQLVVPGMNPTRTPNWNHPSRDFYFCCLFYVQESMREAIHVTVLSDRSLLQLFGYSSFILS